MSLSKVYSSFIDTCPNVIDTCCIYHLSYYPVQLSEGNRSMFTAELDEELQAALVLNRN